ncbi:hypothetical protein AB0O20_06695 [Streptomyces kronopolitis]|uniref:hypothetical protein n=1 Tax=Streptomyces kronopolitis TaxID=1612435 RepID=UPI003443D04F
MTHYPLPTLGLCPVCEGEIRVRKTGVLYSHDCPGGGREPVVRLEPTFARWLWTHAGRRDDRTNRITHLAQLHFRGCTQSPPRTPVDVDWVSAGDLHTYLHDVQDQRTGSRAMQPYSGQHCGWHCEDVQYAAEAYGRLVEVSGRPA